MAGAAAWLLVASVTVVVMMVVVVVVMVVVTVLLTAATRNEGHIFERRFDRERRCDERLLERFHWPLGGEGSAPWKASSRPTFEVLQKCYNRCGDVNYRRLSSPPPDGCNGLATTVRHYFTIEEFSGLIAASRGVPGP